MHDRSPFGGFFHVQSCALWDDRDTRTQQGAYYLVDLLPILAQTGVNDVWDFLKNWGPLGVVLALVVVGWLVPKPSVDKTDQALARTEAQRDSLVHLYEQEIIPLLHDVGGKVLPAVSSLKMTEEGITKELTEQRDDLADLKRLLGALELDIKLVVQAMQRLDGSVRPHGEDR